MSNIQIIHKSITDVSMDAIVNAANDRLAQGGGVCGAIFKTAGADELTKACQKFGYCPTGNAVITPGFESKAKYIIHAVGPIYNVYHKEQVAEQLYSAYQSSLHLAKENNCHSIAFPLISAGIYGYPLNEAWKIALQSCTDWLAQNDWDVMIYFTVLDPRIIDIGQTILESMEQ